MPQLSRELLAKELESVERDIQAVEDQIANDPPDTSGELLRLREIQRTYRGIAASIKTAIALDELSQKQIERSRLLDQSPCYRRLRTKGDLSE